MLGRKIGVWEKVKTIKQSATYVLQELHITHASVRNLYSEKGYLIFYQLGVKDVWKEDLYERE